MSYKEFKKNLAHFKVDIILGLILIFFWFFLSFRITEVPPGINGDEASIGYNAILISKTLHDENNRFLPLFILTLDQKDWKQPLTVYSTAIIFKLFGSSFALLRQISIIYIIVTTFLLFLLTKQLFNVRTAFAAIILFLSTPIIIIQSHLALENIAPLPFLLLWLLMLLRYQKKQEFKFLFLSGLSLGISIYSYNGMRLIFLPLLILNIVYLIYLNKQNHKRVLNIFPFCLGILPFLIILPFVRVLYPGAIFGSARPIEIKSFSQFLFPYLSTYDFSFLFFKGDITPYHSTGENGMFLLPTLPFFLIGVYKTIKNRNPFLILLLSIFAFSPILFGIVGSMYRASRLLVLIPSYTIITAYGLKFLLDIWYLKKNAIILSFIFILFFLSFTAFVKDYWYDYPIRVKENFPSIANITFKKLYEDSQKYNVTPAVEEGFFIQESIGAKFFEQVYFGGSLEKIHLNNQINESKIILIHSLDFPILERQGFRTIDFNEFYSIVLRQ